MVRFLFKIMLSKSFYPLCVFYNKYLLMEADSENFLHKKLQQKCLSFAFNFLSDVDYRSTTE